MAKTPPDVITLLTRRLGVAPGLEAHRRVQIAIMSGYPMPGQTTLVTIGCSAEGYTMWKGHPMGFELTLTTSVDIEGLAQTLAAAAEVHLVRSGGDERRSPVEYNGVYAPGYPPHLLFADALCPVPELQGATRIGKGYVNFLAATPITDADLRTYDRNVPALITQLGAVVGLDDYTAR